MNANPNVTPAILDILAELQTDNIAELHIDTINTVNRWILQHIEDIDAPAEDVAGMVLDLMDLADNLRVIAAAAPHADDIE